MIYNYKFQVIETITDQQYLPMQMTNHIHEKLKEYDSNGVENFEQLQEQEDEEELE